MLVRSEEQSLSKAEKRRLNLHLFLCKYCRDFSRQSLFIDATLKSPGPQLKLDPEFKLQLKELLK